jgi:hypothetical protein
VRPVRDRPERFDHTRTGKTRTGKTRAETIATVLVHHDTKANPRAAAGARACSVPAVLDVAEGGR